MYINDNKYDESYTLDNDILWIVVIIKTRDNHYYDEDGIDAGKSLNCKVAVNHAVELTAEEKEEARREAVRRVHEEYYSRLKQPQKKAKQPAINNQPTLFDGL